MRLLFGIIVALATWAVLTPAPAADFSIALTQLSGEPFRDASGTVQETTLGTVAEVALLASYPDEANLSGEEKVRRYMLAKRIRSAKGDLALTAEEIALVKKLIARAFNPLITGQAWALLDPASVR